MSENNRKGWDAVVLNEADNLATALRHLKAGEDVSFKVGGESRKVTLVTDVALCHKFSIADIQAEEPVLKYGETIGAASQAIECGAHAHVHNIKTLRAS